METVTFTTPDNIEVYVYKWIPNEVKAIVQLTHGAIEHAMRYTQFAERLSEEGYAVYALDLRGHGQTGEKSNQPNIFSKEPNGWLKIIDDLRTLTKQIQVDFPDRPIFLFGHSMGSFLARDYISRHGELFQGVILSGTGRAAPLLTYAGIGLAKLMMLGGRHNPSPFLHQMIFGELNKQVQNPRTDYDFLSRDPAEVDAYIADPWCGRTVTVEFAHEMVSGVLWINKKQAFAQTPNDLPIYLYSGMEDPVGGPKASFVGEVAEAYRRAGVQDVSMKLYEDARHEMLNELNREEVMDDVVAWLDAHL